MSLSNPYSLINLTNNELKEYLSGLNSSQKKYLKDWCESNSITTMGTGDYKLDLLLDKLELLLNPEEYGSDPTLPKYSDKDKEWYDQQYEKKMLKWQECTTTPGWTSEEGGIKNYQQGNNWCSWYWKQDKDGTKYDLTTQYKYLPGPICKENWNKYLWQSSLKNKYKGPKQ